MSHFIVSLIRGKGADSEVLGAVRRQYPQGRVRTEDDVHGAESEQKTVSMGQSEDSIQGAESEDGTQGAESEDSIQGAESEDNARGPQRLKTGETERTPVWARLIYQPRVLLSPR